MTWRRAGLLAFGCFAGSFAATYLLLVGHGALRALKLWKDTQ